MSSPGNDPFDAVGTIVHTCLYIRPMAVRPLTYPERVPNPWGFFMSGGRGLEAVPALSGV